MKTPLRLAAPLFLGLVLPLAAQNLADGLTANAPAKESSQEEPTVLGPQDAKTLDPQLAQSRGVETVINLAVLEKP